MVHYRTKQECIQSLISSQSALATDLADGANSDVVQSLGVKKTKGYKIFRTAHPAESGFHDYTHFLQNAASETLDERHIVASFKHPATGAVTHVTAAEFREWVAANPPAAEEQELIRPKAQQVVFKIPLVTRFLSKDAGLPKPKSMFIDLSKARFITARNWAKTSCYDKDRLVNYTVSKGPLFVTHKCHGTSNDFRTIACLLREWDQTTPQTTSCHG